MSYLGPEIHVGTFAVWFLISAHGGAFVVDVLTPPPLRKHGQGQKNNGHTGSPCLDKPVLARDAQHKETLHTLEQAWLQVWKWV